MTDSGANHYDRLGIGSEATEEEIKRAYFRAIRNHPPETDPVGFQALREAYETLRDPKGRRQYDALLAHGGEIQRLFEEAQALEAGKDFPGAVRSLKRLLVLAPENDAARVRLAFTHLGLGEEEEALRQFDRLCREPQPNPQHLFWAGQVRCSLARKEGLPAARQALLRLEAQDLFTRSSESDPLNAEPHLAMARLHRELGQPAQALECIERAIQADGRVDFQDFEALHLACVIHLQLLDLANFERTVNRIEALSPDLELRRYVGREFGRSAWRALRAGYFFGAEHLVRVAAKFAPEEQWLKQLAVDSCQLSKLNREHARMPPEQPFLKSLLYLELHLGTAGPGETEALQKSWASAMDQLHGAPPEQVLEWGITLKILCPAFYARNMELVDQMLEKGYAFGLARVCRAAGSGLPSGEASCPAGQPTSSPSPSAQPASPSGQPSPVPASPPSNQSAPSPRARGSARSPGASSNPAKPPSQSVHGSALIDRVGCLTLAVMVISVLSILVWVFLIESGKLARY